MRFRPEPPQASHSGSGRPTEPRPHAGLATDGGFVLDDPAGSLHGLEVPQLDRDVDVLTPGRGGRAAFPECVVEALVASAPVAVPVVEQPGLALGEDRVGLGQFAEPGFGIGGVGNIGMPLPGQAVEGALDRSAVRISREAQHLVVVPLSDNGHLWRIVSYHADAATDSGFERYPGMRSVAAAAVLLGAGLAAGHALADTAPVPVPTVSVPVPTAPVPVPTIPVPVPTSPFPCPR